MQTGIVIQLALDTVAAAALYALVALAVSLAYSGSGIVHLAIGQVALLGGLVATVLYEHGSPVWTAALAGLALGAVASGGVERGLVAPTIQSPVTGTVLLLAAGVIGQQALTRYFQQPVYAFPDASHTYRLAGGVVHAYDLVTIAVVVLVAVAGFFTLRSPRVGGSLRLTASAARGAERIGVDTGMVRTASFAVGGALATGALLLGSARFPLVATGVIALPFRGIAGAVAGRMSSPPLIIGAVLLIAAAEVIGGYELGGAGEFLADGVAALLIAAGWRR